MLSPKDTLRTPSVISNLASTGTTTNPTFGSHNASEKKMTRVHMSHGHRSSPPKNIGLHTTNTLGQALPNPNSLPSSPLSPHQLQTHLRFPHSNYLKQVLAPRLHHSILDDVPSRTHTHRPRQHLFKPYLKLTPHSHRYPRLRLNNPYYEIRSTFDMSTNSQLRH